MTLPIKIENGFTNMYVCIFCTNYATRKRGKCIATWGRKSHASPFML